MCPKERRARIRHHPTCNDVARWPLFFARCPYLRSPTYGVCDFSFCKLKKSSQYVRRTYPLCSKSEPPRPYEERATTTGTEISECSQIREPFR